MPLHKNNMLMNINIIFYMFICYIIMSLKKILYYNFFFYKNYIKSIIIKIKSIPFKSIIINYITNKLNP